MKKSLFVFLFWILVQISAFTQPYLITASAGIGGTINPGSIAVASGADQAFNIYPDAGYYISAIIVDGTLVGVPSSYTFTNVLATHTISAAFKLIHLALDKPAYAEDSGLGHVPSYANDADGSNNSYWQGTQTPRWWKVDLQGIYDLTSIVIRNYYDGVRYYHYIIESSNDDVTYTQIAAKNNNNAATDNGDEYTYGTSTPARYLKVTVTLSSVGQTVAISDFRVYGTLITATYPVTASSGTGGTITPQGTVRVYDGADQTFNITPNSDFQIADVIVDGSSVGIVSTYTFTGVTAPHTISATYSVSSHLALNKPSFAEDIYDGHAAVYANDADGSNNNFWQGSQFPKWWKVDLEGIYNLTRIVIRNFADGERFYRYNIEASTDDVTYTQIAAKANDNIASDEGDTYTISTPARFLRVNMTYNSKNQTVVITDFRVYGTSAASNDITVTPGYGGGISPVGTVKVLPGANQTFTITPNTGYQIADVKADNISVGALPAYTFTNVTAPHTISATFAHLPHLALNKTASSSSNEFLNVSSNANDDDGLSYWGSQSDNPQWWIVDLGSSYNIASIVIRNYVDGTRYYSYNIEGSTDGTNYTPVAVKANANVATDAGDTYINLSAIARYLRVTITNNSANTRGQISDFRVYGSLNLTVSGVTANTKAYDGTTVATLNTGSAALVGVVPGDVVNLVSTGATGNFANGNIGTNKIVTTSGFTLDGADAGKYALIQPTATGSITTKELTIGGTFTASTKEYDGTTAATIATNSLTLLTKIGSEDVTLTSLAVFADQTVGTGKTVSLTGSSLAGVDASNYTLSLTGAPTTTADITAKALTIGGTFTATSKEYVGTIAATIATNSLTLLTKVGSEDVTLTPVAVFDDKNVGTGKTISLTGSSLAGADASNYTLSLTGAPATTADITAKALTIGGTFTASTREYDGTTAATIATNSLTLLTIIGSEDVTLTPVVVFADKNVGTGKTVSLTGSSLAGADATNYTLSLAGAPATTADITAKALTIGGTFTASNKEYDGTTAASIATNTLTLLTKVGSEDVALTSVAVFADQNVGTGKTVSLTGSSLTGADITNYTLSLAGAPVTTANITAKQVTITPTGGQSKTEGDPDPVFLYTNSEWIDNTNFTGALGRDAGETPGPYAYILGDLTAGSNYSLVIVASPSTFTISTATGIENNKDISGLKLKSYPNPFADNTQISYYLPVDGRVTLTIHHLTGQLVKTIVSEVGTKGDYILSFNASDLQSGVYIGRLSLKSNGKELLKTIRLVKGR